MKRRRGILILVLAAILVVGLAFGFLHPGEPSFHGKKAGTWLNEYARLDERPAGAIRRNPYNEAQEKLFDDAFREMGTNSLPFIIRRLEQDDSRWRNRYRTSWPKLPDMLRRFLPWPKPRLDPDRAAQAFRAVSPASSAWAVPALKNASSGVRETAVLSLDTQSPSPTPAQANQALPDLIRLLGDPNKMVRLHAAGILGNMGPKASNAVPALILALSDSDAGPLPGQVIFVRAWSAAALGKIGPAAAGAIPALKTLLQTPDALVRHNAATAIWQISGDADTALPVLVRELPLLDVTFHEKREIITTLGEMGPGAKEAVPVLVTGLNPRNPWGIDQKALTNALMKIDPEAAAKLGIK